MAAALLSGYGGGIGKGSGGNRGGGGTRACGGGGSWSPSPILRERSLQGENTPFLLK